MANETTERLRAMAVHRGLTLKASRRRKPGGDFGLYGLADAQGRPVFGMGADGLEATAKAVEAYLRGALAADWKTSVGRTPRRAAAARPRPAPPPPPPPPPPPRFAPEVANLFARLPAAARAEAFTPLLDRPGVRIERIVSAGQATPEDTPMRQNRDEWVIVLAGEAAMRIEDSEEVMLRPGDHLLIAGGQRHWVTRTSRDPRTVWLAVHLG